MEKYTLAISIKDRVVTAKLYEDGRILRKGKAECSEDDDFDTEYGKYLAVRRMLQEPYLSTLLNGDCLVLYWAESPFGWEVRASVCVRRDGEFRVKDEESGWVAISPRRAMRLVADRDYCYAIDYEELIKLYERDFKRYCLRPAKLKEPYQGLCACYESLSDDFEVGKVYDIKNGFILNDKGERIFDSRIAHDAPKTLLLFGKAKVLLI